MFPSRARYTLIEVVISALYAPPFSCYSSNVCNLIGYSVRSLRERVDKTPNNLQLANFAHMGNQNDSPKPQGVMLVLIS